MKSFYSACSFLTPESYRHALAVLGEDEPPVLFAGGTDLMVLLEAGHLRPRRFLNINHLSELKGIHDLGESILIGAATTYTQIRQSGVVQTFFPNLIKAAEVVGAQAIQNRGTVGGNIGNASPAGDFLPGLLSYQSTLLLESAQGEREVSYETFHQDYKRMDLRKGELIKAVRLRKPTAATAHYFRKVGTRKAQSISKVALAASGVRTGGRWSQVRLALASVAPIPLRAFAAEQAVMDGGDVVEALKLDLKPLDDIRSEAAYRQHVAAGLVSAFLGL